VEAEMNHGIVLLPALLLTSCGGGGPGNPRVPVTVVIASTPARDGYIRSDGAVNPGPGLFVGDGETLLPGLSIRAVVGFDLLGAGIPPGATIQSARLSVQQVVVEGTPYGDLGNVLVDHVAMGAAIDAGDSSGNTLLAAIGVLSTDALLVVKSLEVGAQVQADLQAGRAISDFRLRFASDTDADGFNDHVAFVDTENFLSLGQPPLLKVTYLP
jgi:hypothetical protein